MCLCAADYSLFTTSPATIGLRGQLSAVDQPLWPGSASPNTEPSHRHQDCTYRPHFLSMTTTFCCDTNKCPLWPATAPVTLIFPYFTITASWTLHQLFSNSHSPIFTGYRRNPSHLDQSRLVIIMGAEFVWWIIVLLQHLPFSRPDITLRLWSHRCRKAGRGASQLLEFVTDHYLPSDVCHCKLSHCICFQMYSVLLRVLRKYFCAQKVTRKASHYKMPCLLMFGIINVPASASRSWQMSLFCCTFWENVRALNDGMSV